MTSGDTIKSPKQPECPFPALSGQEGQVQVGEYKVLEGSDQEIVIDPRTLIILSSKIGEESKDLIPGVHIRGWYTDNYHLKRYSVVSFLYHKQTSEGELELAERTIVLTGVGYGEHPGHPGQAPTWYLIGPDVARIDPATNDVQFTEPGSEHGFSPKSFSIACITNGPFGDPILANP